MSGRSPDGSGYSAEPEPSCTVSAVPVSIPNAMVSDLRNKARNFKYTSEKCRREARDLDLRASEQFDAFITFDTLADEMEKRLALAIEAQRAETVQQGSVEDESAGPQDNAQ